MNRKGERESYEGSMIKKGESGLVVSSLVAKGIHIEPMKFTKTTKMDAKEQLRFLIHAHINPHLHTYIYRHYNTETPKLI